MKNFTNLVLAMFIALFLASSCKKDSSNPIKDDPTASSGGEHLQFKMNDGSIVNVLYKNGEYIIGGDIILSNEQLEYLSKTVKVRQKETKQKALLLANLQNCGLMVKFITQLPTNQKEVLF